MSQQTRIFASFIFSGIALFLLTTTCVPSRSKLKTESGSISQIIPHKNTWVEVKLLTDSGVSISCKGKRGGPVLGPQRCPVEQFESMLGSSVTISYSQGKPYEVIANGKKLIDYSAAQKAQTISFLIAVLMLAMAVGAWKMRATEK